MRHVRPVGTDGLGHQHSPQSVQAAGFPSTGRSPVGWAASSSGACAMNQSEQGKPLQARTTVCKGKRPAVQIRQATRARPHIIGNSQGWRASRLPERGRHNGPHASPNPYVLIVDLLRVAGSARCGGTRKAGRGTCRRCSGHMPATESTIGVHSSSQNTPLPGQGLLRAYLGVAVTAGLQQQRQQLREVVTPPLPTC